MNRYFAFLVFFIGLSSRLFAQNLPLQNNWRRIDSAIRQRWGTEISHSRDLPHAFVNAFKGAPFMFYWDTYFINKGLLVHGEDTLALNNTKNILDVIARFGYMGNAAVMSWGMNRSQPPFLSQMVWDVYEARHEKDTALLRYAYPLIKKEYDFWTNQNGVNIEDHRTGLKGLQRYGTHASKEELVALYKELEGRFHLADTVSDNKKSQLAYSYAVEAATGMDFTPRFEHRCPDFVALDLNCLLYRMEINLSRIARRLGLRDSLVWAERASSRKDLINRYCWNRHRGIYTDYDYVHHRSSRIAAATTFMPLWAGIASPGQAKKVMQNLMLFDTKWGLATIEHRNQEIHYQWGPLSVWAPLQLIAVEGLNRYGFKKQARALAAKYLNLVTKNYIKPVPASYQTSKGDLIRPKGYLYEKYTVKGDIDDSEYTANQMMGWTAGVYAYLYAFICKAAK